MVLVFNVRRPLPYRAGVLANGVMLTGMMARIEMDGTTAQFQPDGSEQSILIVPEDVDEHCFLEDEHEEPPFAWESSPSTI
jgi:hypothetical protein